ncbi:MAG: hypothetical protein RJA46_1220 [Pseudomonadota bacterium]
MNSAQTFHSNFSRGRPTKKESTKRAFSFSLAAHLGLLAFLVIGINWNNSTPSGVEVELWDASQQVETPIAPEVKTEMKEDAADIAIKKKPVEKEPPKKEIPKEVPKAIQPPPPPPKEKVKELPKKEVPKPVQAPPPPKEKEVPKKVEAKSPAMPQLRKFVQTSWHAYVQPLVLKAVVVVPAVAVLAVAAMHLLAGRIKWLEK